jgi:hypothetical protein
LTMKAIVTLESLKEASACYFNEPEDTQRLQALLPPAGLPVTAASVELARAADVPERDIFWSLNYACPQVTDRMRRLTACACARRALEAARAAGRETDVRSWRAVEVAERFARGEATETELAWARLAAWETWKTAVATRSAARAAWDAAWDTAWLTAWLTEAAGSSASESWRFAVDTFVKIINQEGTN